MPAYCEYPAPKRLKTWVECCWSLETRADIPAHRVVPDGCLDILYQRGRGVRVIGSMCTAEHVRVPARSLIVGVRFHPGMAAAFLDAPAFELTDVSVPLDDLLPGLACELTKRLDLAPSARAAAHTLGESLRPSRENLSPVQRALAWLNARHGDADLAALAAEAGLSLCHFRRRCLEESGLSPKLLARILRFRRAYNTACALPAPDWARIAAENGYFDQAHLIRDFRTFCGSAPMAVFSKRAADRPLYA